MAVALMGGGVDHDPFWLGVAVGLWAAMFLFAIGGLLGWFLGASL